MKIKHATQYPASLRLLLGVVIATFVFTGAANAQPSFAGKFTLPYEVRWGQAVLPAGDYVIRMDATASPARITPANGSSAGVYTEYPLVQDSHTSGTYLTITHETNQRRVRSLNLPQIGKMIVFAPLTKGEREAYAKAGQINTVPVVTAKK
jgi:hypothetical protein